MKDKNKFISIVLFSTVGLVSAFLALQISSIFQAKSQTYNPGQQVIPVSSAPNPTENALQLHTFTFITLTPTPSSVPTKPVKPIPSSQQNPGGPIPITTPAIGGPASPSDNFYCMDDVDPDMCDDNTSHHVPKGVGGIVGPCGTVIEQTHKLVDALPQYMKGLRDQLTKAVTNCSYTTGPVTGYLSTHFVIDAYNLAGFKELSKANPSHVSSSGLYAWWQSQPTGYVFIPYTPAVIQQFAAGQNDLTGCVMFLKTGAGYHIGIVNKLEVYTPGGDGVISILQAGTRMYIDRFPVVGWSVSNTSTNQTSTSGVAGFGCHT